MVMKLSTPHRMPSSPMVSARCAASRGCIADPAQPSERIPATRSGTGKGYSIPERVTALHVLFPGTNHGYSKISQAGADFLNAARPSAVTKVPPT